MTAARTDLKVRNLTVQDLGLPPPSGGDSGNGAASKNAEQPAPEPPLPPDDPYLAITLDLKSDGFAGVIFSGPPGTGKTWYARKIALALCDGVMDRTAFVQFHPSYQYEDFVQGYVPTNNGFAIEPKVFAILCDVAREDLGSQYVLVIDEFSRTDAARVFGELLTYIETSKRGMPFLLQSGYELTVPENIFIIATMNPWDKGVDDMDVALERRFATIEFLPDPKALAEVISGSSLAPDVKAGIGAFFEALQRIDNEQCHIGQAYFAYVTDAASLTRLWRYRLHPHFRRACRTDKALLKKIESMWGQLVARKLEPSDAPPAEAGDAVATPDGVQAEAPLEGPADPPPEAGNQ